MFSFFQLIFEWLYCLLPFHWRLLYIMSSTFLSSVNVGYLATFIFIWRRFVDTSLPKSGMYPLSTARSSNDVFWNMFRQLHSILCWCVPVPAHDVSNVISLAHMTRNVVDCIIDRYVRELFCGGFAQPLSVLSLPFLTGSSLHVC